MNPRINMDKASKVREVTPWRRGMHMRSSVRLAALTIAFMVSQAAAQDCKQAGCNPATCGKAGACGAGTPGTSGQPEEPKSPVSGNVGTPKWSCAEPNITVSPLWHGGDINCTFQILNEGDADLKINVRGG